MSILDTFTILFDSNAEEVEAGLDTATAAGERLQDALGDTGATGAEAFDKVGEHAAASQKQQEEVAAGSVVLKEHLHEAGEEGVSAFDKIKEHAKEMTERLIEHAFEVAAAFQALFAVEKLVDNFFEQGERSDQLGETAKSLGVNIEELDAWGEAVKRVGGSSEGFQQSLRTVNLNLERVALTGHSRMLPFLKELGVSLKTTDGHVKTSFELLAEIPEHIDKMDKSKSGAILRGIGLDEGTIRLMQAGSKETEELVNRAKELGSITKEDAEVAEKFNREWMDIHQIFRNITVALDTLILPALGFLLNIVEDIMVFLRDHKDLAVGFLIAITAGALYAAEAFGILDFAIAVLTSPITLLVAAIAGVIAIFAFLYDDVMAFAEGNNSVIGELAKRWPIVGDAVHGLISIFEDVKDGIVEAFHEIMQWINKIPEGFEQWKEIFGIVGDYITSVAEKISKAFEGLPGPIKAVLEDIGAIAGIAFKGIEAAGGFAFETLLAIAKAFAQAVGAVFKLIADLVVDPMHAFQTFANTLDGAIIGLIKAIPGLTEAFTSVGKAFDGIGAGIIKLWHDIADVVTGTVGKVTGAIGAIGSWFHAPTMFGHKDDGDKPEGGKSDKASKSWFHAPTMFGHIDPEGAEAAQAGSQAARDHAAGAASPLLAQTPAGTAATATNIETHKSVTINAPTTITTQSTDPAAIKSEFDRGLGNHLDSAINHYADGIRY